jgi:lambda repressor-like predicted transcriptional regulator
MLKRILKLLHEIGSVGVMGSLAACIVLAATAPRHAPVEFAAVRQAISAINQWLLVPSLAIVLISGLLAIAATDAYINAGWAWVKALLGVSTFEGTLVTISGSAHQAAELSALAVSGQGEPERLAEVLRTEWIGMWVIMAVALANIVLAIWRPRFGSRKASAGARG